MSDFETPSTAHLAEPNGRLSIVATPIGNLEDITLRALRTFKECEYVLCEDTRMTGKLLSHYEIKKPLKRYDAHTSEGVHAQVLADLAAGQHLVLVSDAGTPGVSDPGVLLVARARQAGARIDAIPGPSAVTAAVSIAGFTGNQFTFLGFVPLKKGRETFFKSLATAPYPTIFFESTHRILKTLAALATHAPTATVYVGRELTKFHEEMLVDTPAHLLTILTDTPVKQKGEFVIIVDARRDAVY